MSTLRQDPTTNEWVVLAPHRALRPGSAQDPSRPPLPPRDPGCPFCPGNEHQTPPEILRRPADGDWDQRVFPNLFPALSEGGSTERGGDRWSREMTGVGRHEVVVESPRHDERMEEMSTERVASVIDLWRERYRTLKQDPAVKAIIVFKNFGEGAGTSLVHPHSQILATPVFPPESLHRYAVATRYYDDTGHCVYVDLFEQERRAGTRVVAETEEFIAVAPFAAAVPYEVWIAPRVHQTSFDRLGDHELPALAELLMGVLGALRRAAGDPDYNLIIQSAPTVEELKPFFQWHLRLLPRTSTPAGFELGTAMSINTVTPEESATVLREALTAAGVD